MYLKTDATRVKGGMDGQETMAEESGLIMMVLGGG
jgi:hypothetical protein